MNDVEAIFSQVLDSAPDAALVNEANDQTLPAGTYRLEVTKKEVVSAGDKSPWPGRLMIHVAADAYTKLENGDMQRKGKLFFDLSPSPERFENGKLDGPTKLWANMVAVAKKNGGAGTNRDVYDCLDQYPLRAYITRPFKQLDGKWSSPKTEDEAKALLEEGAIPRNFVQSLGAWNA